ncbi:MAG: hypothetical protein GFH27_549289n301 [Chloroflexi bacterium AL-W]|nr:hypothetical protein [Chloroflexi bacterium AL-N1]NOK67033.1 hypothetical protein [Chloroflexi bacterium AL-N10]NOK74675.1 hypothetical protein [Chloroflexi bacterium AL-N5]NOK81635.1 hypothetical protein [Chloroflexi bacterium AL-W]NOK89105.1 hypothetical protein [Chloroflexi bacterium AL-N15]
MMSMMLALLQGEEGVGIFSTLLSLVIVVAVIAGMWKVFTKAGQPGWAAIIPIYNVFVLLKIGGRPWWWLLLLFVPVVNIIVLILIWFDLAKAFGKGVGFALGLYFMSPIFIPLLGFGDAEYVGPPNGMPTGATT